MRLMRDMPRRTKKSIRYVSKYEKDAVLMQAKVLKIELLNEEIKERLKSFFYVESKTIPEGRKCVHWGRCNISEGDEIVAKGRLNNDGVFLIWSMMILKKHESEEV